MNLALLDCSLCRAGCIACLLVLPPLAVAAPPGAPSAGTILKQNTPPPSLPTAPGAVIQLPAPQQQTAASSLQFTVKHIIIEGNTLVPTADLTPLVASAENHRDTLASLKAAAARITALYHQRGYPLAYAYLPAQQIKNGIVKIAVVEPRYDHIAVQYATPQTRGLPPRLQASQARKTLGLQPGQPVEQSSLERGLLLLNQTPGVRVAGTLVPGSQPATTTLQATVTDTPVMRATLGVDDYGSNFTGRMRTLVNASLDDPFGYGGQLAVNGLVTSGGLLKSTGGSITSPDLWNGLRVGAYASHTTYTLGGQFAPLEEGGTANQYGGDIQMPLILAPGRILAARLDLLHDDFRQSSAVVGSNDHSTINLARLALNGALADALQGVTSGGLSVTLGYNHISSAGARAADAAGPQTRGHFWIAQARVQRSQALPARFHLRASLSGQVASRNLDGSQKFYLGGPAGVMGYAVGEGGGDQGVLARLGLFHAIPLPLPGSLTFGALLQGGEVWRYHSRFGGALSNNRLRMAGAGPELAYQFESWVAIQLDYIRQLGATLPTHGANSHGQLWGSLRISF